MVSNRLPISLCAHFACVLEATARKPGNVHRFRDFDDTSFVDFLLSAGAIAPVMDDVQERGVGSTILEAIRRTRQVTTANTNLGIVLLLTPLAAVPPEIPADEGVGEILAGLTVADAQACYEAIRLARPGGLGNVPEQDIAGEPTLTLREVMALAAERDLVARQYASGFHEVFWTGVPALLHALKTGWPIEEAVIYCHLRLMAAYPDSLIARKRGPGEATESARRAADVLARGWPETESARAALRELDTWLRAVGHERNPGTTADLVTTCLFVALREGRMQIPMPQPWSSNRMG